MRILVTPTSFQKPENIIAARKLEAFADEIVYNDLGRPLTAEEIVPRLDGVDGYIAGLDYITETALKNAPDSLKVISRYGAGVDRVDMAAAKEKGITVTNTPGTNSVAVSELAFGLMLCAARKIPKLNSAVRAGEWPRSQGIELCGKILGIVGLGAIGKNLATRAIAFGMKVLAFDPYFDEKFAEQNGIFKTEPDELLKNSDFVSLHLPLNEKTRHFISAEVIANMKKGAIIINTARGGLIDETAAAAALNSGQLGGLGLDAFEQEPPTDSPLFGFDNVIMTPHTGAHTAEAVSGMGEMAVDNLIAVLTGDECKYTVK